MKLINEIINTPIAEENGATLNLDMSPYTGKGIALGCISQNVDKLNLTYVYLMAEVLKVNKITDVKIGLYKFPNQRKYCVDVVLILPESKIDVVVETARILGQESVYNLRTGENIKTGNDGMSPVKIQIGDIKYIRECIRKNVVPQIVKVETTSI